MATIRKRTPTAGGTAVAKPDSAWNSSPISPSNPIFKESGNDERGRVQNRIVDEQSRYRQQMDPYMSSLKGGFDKAMMQGTKDYGDIMNQMGQAGNTNVGARSIGYTDPFQSYGNYQNLAKTGGYSDQDMADLRARGTAPIRAAYANAGREVSRGRSLQGGYSPNAAAVQAKMAREQSQSMSDAMQGVNAGIIQNRNAGQLSGMQGMTGIEGQRLGAQLDTGKFNATAGMQTDQFNAGNKLDALSKMGSLYGTTPGMAKMFGDQLGNAIGDSGQQGTSYINSEGMAQQLPGQYENVREKVTDVAGMASPYLKILEDYLRKKAGVGISNPTSTTGQQVP